MTTLTAEYRNIVHRLIEDCFNQGNFEVIDQSVSNTYVDHTAPKGIPAGPEGLKVLVSSLRSAFPDLSSEIDDEIAEDDKVAIRATHQGTMKQELFGIQPTGKHAKWTETTIFRFADGRIVESWAHVDLLGMFQQLGLVSSPFASGR